MNVLLHSCCGPCSVWCVESLRAEAINPVLFWYNPNIHPYQEYKARRDSLADYARALPCTLIVREDYGLREFLRQTATAPDQRCRFCYAMRLEECARYAAQQGYSHICTTLFISPYQNHELLRQTAQTAAQRHGVALLYRDFRPGFRQGQSQAKEQALYLQKYCGCIFSEEERYARQIQKQQGQTTLISAEVPPVDC